MQAGESYRRQFNRDPQTIISVPGVVVFFGEFSNYCRGNVLCCAGKRRLDVCISESNDNQVRIHNTFSNDNKRFGLSSLKFRKEDKWGNYIKGVYHELSARGIRVPAFDMLLEGDVLNSDSATLAASISVGVCVALNVHCNLGLQDDDIARICYDACTAFCAEIPMYYTIVTILKAQEGKYLLFNLGNLTFKYLDDPFEGSGTTLLAVNCNVPPTAIREEVRHRHKQVSDAFEVLKEKSGRTVTRDFPVSDLADRIVHVDEQTRRICMAVLENSNAASAMERFFGRRDFASMGKAMIRMGNAMCDEMEISIPEEDWLIKRAVEIPQCYGAQPVNCGGNACVVVSIADSALERYKMKFEEYERIFGFRILSMPFRPDGRWIQVKEA